MTQSTTNSDSFVTVIDRRDPVRLRRGFGAFGRIFIVYWLSSLFTVVDVMSLTLWNMHSLASRAGYWRVQAEHGPIKIGGPL